MLSRETKYKVQKCFGTCRLWVFHSLPDLRSQALDQVIDLVTCLYRIFNNLHWFYQWEASRWSKLQVEINTKLTEKIRFERPGEIRWNMSKIPSIGEKALKQFAMNIFNNLSMIHYLWGIKTIHQNVVPFTRDSKVVRNS